MEEEVVPIGIALERRRGRRRRRRKRNMTADARRHIWP
jgi:hypothetical protein